MEFIFPFDSCGTCTKNSFYLNQPRRTSPPMTFSQTVINYSATDLVISNMA